MKITTKQYATGLYDLVQDKNKSEIDDIVKNFVFLLKQRRQLKLARKIIEKLDEIYNKKNGIIEAKIVSREKLNSELVNRLTNYVGEKYKAEKVILTNEVDENIGGGIVIRVKDEVLDGSLKSHLAKLNKLLKA